jgi:hypothetical protein
VLDGIDLRMRGLSRGARSTCGEASQSSAVCG